MMTTVIPNLFLYHFINYFHFFLQTIFFKNFTFEKFLNFCSQNWLHLFQFSSSALLYYCLCIVFCDVNHLWTLVSFISPAGNSKTALFLVSSQTAVAALAFGIARFVGARHRHVVCCTDHMYKYVPVSRDFFCI